MAWLIRKKAIIDNYKVEVAKPSNADIRIYCYSSSGQKKAVMAFFNEENYDSSKDNIVIYQEQDGNHTALLGYPMNMFQNIRLFSALLSRKRCRPPSNLLICMVSDNFT